MSHSHNHNLLVFLFYYWTYHFLNLFSLLFVFYSVLCKLLNLVFYSVVIYLFLCRFFHPFLSPFPDTHFSSRQHFLNLFSFSFPHFICSFSMGLHSESSSLFHQLVSSSPLILKSVHPSPQPLGEFPSFHPLARIHTQSVSFRFHPFLNSKCLSSRELTHTDRHTHALTCVLAD